MIIKLTAKLFFIFLVSFVFVYTKYYYRNNTIKNKLLIKRIINKIKLIEKYEDIIKIREINKENNIEKFEKLNGKVIIEHKQDDLTIITAFYAIKSKHSFPEYLNFKSKESFILLTY